MLQNTSSTAFTGNVHFWSAGGAFLGSHLFTLVPRAGLVLDTSILAGLAGQSGSITVSHAGGYGALAGKAVSLEPATGYSFDTPLVSRPR